MKELFKAFFETLRNTNSDHIVFTLSTNGNLSVDFLNDFTDENKDIYQQVSEITKKQMFLEMIDNSMNSQYDDIDLAIGRSTEIGGRTKRLHNFENEKCLLKTDIFNAANKKLSSDDYENLSEIAFDDCCNKKSYFFKNRSDGSKNLSYKMFQTSKLSEQVKFLKIISQFFNDNTDKNGIIRLNNFNMQNLINHGRENSAILRNMYIEFKTFCENIPKFYNNFHPKTKDELSEIKSKMYFESSFDILRFLKEMLVLCSMIKQSESKPFIDKMQKCKLNFNSFIQIYEGSNVKLSVFQFFESLKNIAYKDPEKAKNILKDLDHNNIKTDDEIDQIISFLQNNFFNLEKIEDFDDIKKLKIKNRLVFNENNLDINKLTSFFNNNFNNNSVISLAVPIASKENLINNFFDLLKKSSFIIDRFFDFNDRAPNSAAFLKNLSRLKNKKIFPQGNEEFPNNFFNIKIAELLNYLGIIEGYSDFPAVTLEELQNSLSSNQTNLRGNDFFKSFFRNVHLPSQLFKAYKNAMLIKKKLDNSKFFNDDKYKKAVGMRSVSGYYRRNLDTKPIRNNSYLPEKFMDSHKNVLMWNPETEKRNDFILKRHFSDVYNSSPDRLDEFIINEVFSYKPDNFFYDIVCNFHRNKDFAQMQENIIKLIFQFAFKDGVYFPLFFRSFIQGNEEKKDFKNKKELWVIAEYSLIKLLHQIVVRCLTIAMEKQNLIKNEPSKICFLGNVKNDENFKKIIFEKELRDNQKNLMSLTSYNENDDIIFASNISIEKPFKSKMFSFFKNIFKNFKIFCKSIFNFFSKIFKSIFNFFSKIFKSTFNTIYDFLTSQLLWDFIYFVCLVISFVFSLCLFLTILHKL